MRHDPLTQLESLEIHAEQAEVVEHLGRAALRLQNGLALLDAVQAQDVTLDVEIAAEGPCYPGLVFRADGPRDFELAYAQPHTSGLWDALQYDPVFHGSNTWQIFHGPAYQAAAQAPTGAWFHLRVSVSGTRAAVQVEDQPPLVVEHLARGQQRGRVGVWTYLPAYFANLCVRSCQHLDVRPGQAPVPPERVLDAWYLEDFGVAACEPNGVLCLNRFLPPTLGQVTLTRRFATSADRVVAFDFGFSDSLILDLDGQAVFTGAHTFAPAPDRPMRESAYAARGYVDLSQGHIELALPAGMHRLSARLGVSEPFGWGLILRARGVDWLPVV